MEIRAILILFLTFSTLTIPVTSLCERPDGVNQGTCKNTLEVLGVESVFTYPQIGYTQEAIYASSLNYFIGVPLMNYECAQSYLKLMCPTIWRPCDGDGFVRMGVEMCEQVNLDCDGFFSSVGISGLDCSMSDPLFPTEKLYVYNSTFNSTNEPIEYDCPSPLIFVGPNTDPYTDLPCSSTCHDKLRMVNPSLDAQFIVTTIFSWISLILTIAVLIVYQTSPTLHKMPQRVIFYMGAGMFLEHLAMVGTSISVWSNSFDSTFCKNDYELKTTGWVAASAFLLFVGALMAASWWLVQSFVVFWCIALRRHTRSLFKYTWPFKVWCWGYPILAAFIVLLVSEDSENAEDVLWHGMGALQGNPWAFTSWLSIRELNWALFYTPIIVYLFIVVILTVVSGIKLMITGVGSTALRHRNFQISLYIFTIAFLSVAISVIAAVSRDQQHIGDINDSISAWYYSIFTTGQEIALETTRNTGLIWFMVFTIPLQGTGLFIVFVLLSSHVRNIVKIMLTNVSQGKWPSHGLDNSTSQTSSKSNSNSGTSIGRDDVA